MRGMYDPSRMMEYFNRFYAVRTIVIGAGAVGTCLAEHLAKMGIGRITLVDMDRFTPDNAAKHSGMIRTPEDVGRKKAAAAAQRAGALMTEGGAANGIDAEITLLGPWALAGYDFIFAALDNYAAKLYLNQIWLRIPARRRPVLIQGGTFGEMAQANVLDGTGACWRCLCDESWFAEAGKRTSCAGPQYRMEEGMPVRVRTSGLASDMAAHLMAEAMRAIVLGEAPDKNCRIFYSAYPNFSLHTAVPMRRGDCPDCRRIRPPKSLRMLRGGMRDLTLRDALGQIEEQLEEGGFELQAHTFSYAGAGYSGVIVQDRCRSCGELLPAGHSHEGRTRRRDQLCAACREAGRRVVPSLETEPARIVYAFVPGDVPEYLLTTSLFDLGWPLGGYLKVRAGSGLDAMDDGVRTEWFACEEDTAEMERDLVLG